MSKMGRMIKRVLVSAAVFLMIVNPFIPFIALAEENVATQTGEAVSNTVAVSEVNTTKVESQVDVVVTQIDEPTTESLAPFPVTITPTPSPSTASASQNVTVSNEVSVTTKAESAASTGGNNQVASESATMKTGDATSLSTAVSLANTTLMNSSLQIGVIVVTDTWYGDIVIDPVEWENPSATTQVTNLEITNNVSSVNTIASASAESGNNYQYAEDEAEMTTGEAGAIAQANALINTTLVNADVFTFLPENIWLWSGNIRNWKTPGSISAPAAISNLTGQAQNDCAANSCNTSLATENQAEVTTIASALATTGDNSQISGKDAAMTTGDAYAGAVATSLVNTTMINSRYRQLSLLLFSPWVGDLVFAYPDLGLKISAPSQVNEGEEAIYLVTTKNYGYAKAKNITLGVKAQINGTTVYEAQDKWDEQSAGTETTKIFTINTSGMAGQMIVFGARVANDITEESTLNNQAEYLTTVSAKTNNDQSSSNTESVNSAESPKLRLTATNNIHEFVYPGDQVSYDMTIYNEGEVKVDNIVLTQDFYSPNGDLISQFQGKVGSIPAHGKRSIHFLLKTNASLVAGHYYTESHAYGTTPRGNEAKTNIVRNEVVLRIKTLNASAVLGEHSGLGAQALSNEQEQILGAALAPKSCGNCLSFPWYVAITLGTVVYYMTCRHRVDYARAIRYGIALPLAAYVGLIMSNPNCVQRIVMLPSAGIWCEWFLLLACLIYFAIMSIKPTTNWVKRRLLLLFTPATVN